MPLALAWIAKEKLRAALNLRARVTGSAPCERQVRDRLFAFYDWCAAARGHPRAAQPRAHDLPVGRRDRRAVLTGVTNDLASHCTSC